jgi:nucleoside-diphosphate-sugar epimerase
MKILITGGSGLVGQSLLKVLDVKKHLISVYDKDNINNSILKKNFPSVDFFDIDLSDMVSLDKYSFDYDCVVILQAQISGTDYSIFKKNTITSTINILSHIDNSGKEPYLIFVSSSVINSKADDFYTQSKRMQEQIISSSKLKKIILRPTLMYGEGDNKHFYVLLKLMKIFHILPLPSFGNYIRQPLFSIDFANVIKRCILKSPNGIYNISGLELIRFNDCLQLFKRRHKIKAIFLPVPISLFRFVLLFLNFFKIRTPFTAQQLDALVIPEVFEMIDWPTIFKTKYTPFKEAHTKFEYKL